MCSILKFVYCQLKRCVILSFKLFVFFQCCHNMKYNCYQDYPLMVCFNYLFVVDRIASNKVN